MEDSLNTRVLKRLGYFVAETEDSPFFGVRLYQLCFPDGLAYTQIYSDMTEYGNIEEWLFMQAQQVNPFPLFEGLRWQLDCLPTRVFGKSYQVHVNEYEEGFGEADTLEMAMLLAWDDYMERKDRREQKRGTHEAD